MTTLQPVKNVVKWPLRRMAASLGEHRSRDGEPRLWVLMYHRVLPADDPRFLAEEPGMVVTPETFAMHLQWFRDNLQLVKLAEWVRAVEAGEALPARACAITFDDGWRDNFEFAWPLLEEYRAPATIFAVSHMIGTDTQFWPNRLSHLLQHLPDQWRDNPDLNWLTRLGDVPDAPDRETIAALILRAKSMPDPEITALLDRAEERRGDAASRPPAALLDWEQLRAMCNSGLVDVGSHTCYHSRLTDDLDEQATRDAICDSREKIAAEMACDVPLFCYPNGDSNQYADAIVESVYRAAVTTQHGINRRDSSRYRLARISLHEGNSDTPLKLAARLSGWRGV